MVSMKYGSMKYEELNGKYELWRTWCKLEAQEWAVAAWVQVWVKNEGWQYGYGSMNASRYNSMNASMNMIAWLQYEYGSMNASMKHEELNGKHAVWDNLKVCMKYGKHEVW